MQQSRDALETLAMEVLAARPRVAQLEEENRRLAGAPPVDAPALAPPPDVRTMLFDDLETLAAEVFAQRRRVVELEVENRRLRVQAARTAPMEPPVPKTPESGIAFGIADASGRREVVVTGAFARIGKDPKSQVVLEGARSMHAVIERDATGVSIIDLGTQEGTLVNGERIRKALLASGDRLVIADATLVVVFR